MARNGRTAGAASGARAKRPANAGKTAPAAAAVQSPPATADVEGTGTGPLRDWLQHNTELALGMAAFFGQTQRLAGEAISSYSDALAQTAREIEQAEDLAALMAVPSHALGRQMDLAMRTLGESTRQLLEAEWQWAGQAREQAQALGAAWLPVGNGAEATPVDAAGEDAPQYPAPLQGLGDARAAWITMSQRWVDALRESAQRAAVAAQT